MKIIFVPDQFHWNVNSSKHFARQKYNNFSPIITLTNLLYERPSNFWQAKFFNELTMPSKGRKRGREMADRTWSNRFRDRFSKGPMWCLLLLVHMGLGWDQETSQHEDIACSKTSIPPLIGSIQTDDSLPRPGNWKAHSCSVEKKTCAAVVVERAASRVSSWGS